MLQRNRRELIYSIQIQGNIKIELATPRACLHVKIRRKDDDALHFFPSILSKLTRRKNNGVLAKKPLTRIYRAFVELTNSLKLTEYRY